MKTWKKKESFANFLIFGVICVSFWGPWGPCSQLKNSMKSSQLPTGNYILSLLTFFIVPIYKVRQKLGKNAKNLWKMEKFGEFVVFGVILRHCHSENFNKLFAKTYWALYFFLVDPFHCSNLQSLSKIWEKIQKNHWKLENFGVFVIFGVNLRHFHIKKFN